MHGCKHKIYLFADHDSLLDDHSHVFQVNFVRSLQLVKCLLHWTSSHHSSYPSIWPQSDRYKSIAVSLTWNTTSTQLTTITVVETQFLVPRWTTISTGILVKHSTLFPLLTTAAVPFQFQHPETMENVQPLLLQYEHVQRSWSEGYQQRVIAGTWMRP